ncbi:hypothetical protein EVAR_51495_1 [Eumeta japonica]|uniref:Uncharacterized protein n=1 Tax=Eumeta variegata TaxID=151549 RepID=A0A4C1XD97_EUMVA|nr:hypothetical protein EVAR_51495_1 [Eumeta japonica]
MTFDEIIVGNAGSEILFLINKNKRRDLRVGPPSETPRLSVGTSPDAVTHGVRRLLKSPVTVVTRSYTFES